MNFAKSTANGRAFGTEIYDASAPCACIGARTFAGGESATACLRKERVFQAILNSRQNLPEWVKSNWIWY